MIAAALEGGPLPPDAEPRLEQFTELVGTAIANAEARVELARLADEQAALRRVATLVAEEAPAAELFAKVAEEVAGVFGRRIDSAILRYERRRHGDRGGGVGRAAAGRHPRRRAAAGRRQRRDRAGVPRAAPGPRGRLRRRGRRHRRPRRRSTGSAPRSAARSWCRAASGARWSSPTTKPSRSPPIPSGASRSSRSSWPRRSPTRRRAPSCERLADEQAALRRVATLVAEAARADRGVRRGHRGGGPAARSGAGRHDARREPGRGHDRRPARAGPRARPGRHARAARRRQRHRPRPADRPLGADRPLRGGRRRHRRARPPLERQRHGRRADHGRGPALGRDHRELGAGSSCRPPTRRSAWPSSRSCSTRRSRTPTAAISSPRPAPACSPRATRRAGGSSATSTTAPSSAWSTRSSR